MDINTNNDAKNNNDGGPTGGSITITYPQDSIHPPDLIHLNVNVDSDNPSPVPSPDSPLSTPPNSPRRSLFSVNPNTRCVDDDDDYDNDDNDDNDTGDHNDKKEEEGNKEKDVNQGPAIKPLGPEDAPIDEQENNDSNIKSNSNCSSNPSSENGEFPSDEPPKGKVTTTTTSIEIDSLENNPVESKEETKQEATKPLNILQQPSLSPTNSDGTSFDEACEQKEEDDSDNGNGNVGQDDKSGEKEETKQDATNPPKILQQSSLSSTNSDGTPFDEACEKKEEDDNDNDANNGNGNVGQDDKSGEKEETKQEATNPPKMLQQSSLSPTKSDGTPFDEAYEQEEEEEDDKSIDKNHKADQDDESASVPDDEKTSNDSLPLVVEPTKTKPCNDADDSILDRYGDEVMANVPKPQTATSATAATLLAENTEANKSVEVDVDVYHGQEREVEEEPLSMSAKSMKPKSKQVSAIDTTKNMEGGDIPVFNTQSLSLVEQAKLRLSAHGLSGFAKPGINDSNSNSNDVISPPRIYDREEQTEKTYREEEKPRTENHDDVEVDADAKDSDIDEPPSLSRVEEAMKRTSLMVLKHNRRREKNTPPRVSKETTATIMAVSSTTTASTSTTPNKSESDRLVALQRDIMSLKSSLSDMNSKLCNKDDPSSTRRMENNLENHTLFTSFEEDIYNDIPLTSMPAKTPTISTLGPDDEGKENNSLEQQSVVAMVLPNREIDAGNNESILVNEGTPRIGTIDTTFLSQSTTNPSDLHADDEKDEIMTPKRQPKSSLSQVFRDASIPKDDHDGKTTNANITLETTELSFSQEKSSHTRSANEYRKMTPKKDLQGSDNSHGWLQEELQRRAVVKREINNAIEARGRYGMDDNENNKAVVDQLPSISSPPELQSSRSTTADEEVAAITANDERNLSAADRGVDNLISNDEQKASTDAPMPRKIDYDDRGEKPGTDFMNPNTLMKDNNGFQGFQPVFMYQDIQHEMMKFASETRAALREQSFTDIVRDPFSSAVPVAFSSPMSVNRSLNAGKPDANPDFQMNAIANSTEESNNIKGNAPINIKFSDLEGGEVPIMLNSMDSFDGVATGDIFLSLLSDNTGRTETSAAATWANRVHVAIWRARRMRRSMSRVPPDAHQPIVMGGSQTVASVQRAALLHLKRDEINDSINLIEGITFAYYSYFERSLNLQEKNLSLDSGGDTVEFKPYIGTALHNLGVLNLLNASYDEALSYFIRAVENRKGYLGEDHPHYISSLVRVAICRYALNEFAEAHAGLEEALMCAKKIRIHSKATLEDRLQMAEILNNLGCLAYMSGQPTAASSYYRESMDIQFAALSDSLYLGNAISGQSISLNISIARANIGFIKLVTKDLPIAITALENALMEQQILLKGTNDTLIATMDHLALSNLLNGAQDKAALMYNRILTLQQREHGPHDRRCFVTVDKINMVQGKGVQYEGAIEELRKTFSFPIFSGPPSVSGSSLTDSKSYRSPPKEKTPQAKKSGVKRKKNKVLKALSSVIKKNS